MEYLIDPHACYRFNDFALRVGDMSLDTIRVLFGCAERHCLPGSRGLSVRNYIVAISSV
jgi:hypothetical protein